MRLVDWRREEGLSQQELADHLGCTQSFISLIERAVDPQIPRDPRFIVRLYRFTRGAVTANDFYDYPDIDSGELPLEAAPVPLFGVPPDREADAESCAADRRAA